MGVPILAVPHAGFEVKPTCLQGFSDDGASETRTRDLLGAIQALSQLSYSPVRRAVPPGGAKFSRDLASHPLPPAGVHGCSPDFS